MSCQGLSTHGAAKGWGLKSSWEGARGYFHSKAEILILDYQQARSRNGEEGL